MIGFTAGDAPKPELPNQDDIIKTLEDAIRRAASGETPASVAPPPAPKRYALVSLFIDGSKFTPKGIFDLGEAELEAANIMAQGVGKVVYVEIHEITSTPKFRLIPAPVVKPYTVQTL